MRQINTLRITPQGPNEQPELEAVTIEFSLASLCNMLGCQPAQLRAIRHSNWAIVGFAASTGPVHIDICDEHPITLRGPSLVFLLRDAKDRTGQSFEQIDWSLPPIQPDALERFRPEVQPGEGSYELMPWANPTTCTAFPTRAEFDAGEQVVGSRREMPEIIRRLSEALGGDVQVIDLAKFGGGQQQAEPIVHGDRAFDAFAIEKMLWDDSPKQFPRLLEVPAYVSSAVGHFPTPSAMVISMLSFYARLLKDVHDQDQVDPAQALARIKEVQELSKLIVAFRDGNKQPEWPLTSELWFPKEES